MKNLTYKSVSVMKKTKEASSSQITIEEKQNLVACLANIGVTHVEITMLADDNADLISHGFTPSPRSIEDETKQWYDVIHAQPNVYGAGVFGGYLKVYDRAVFSGIEGIVGYSHDTNTPVGTAASAATDGNDTWCGRYYNYLVNHVGSEHIETGDIQCPIPEITGSAFSGNFFTSQVGAVTCVQQFHAIADAFYATQNKTCVFMNNPNFSEVTSGWWGAGAYSDTGIVCYDYYGNNRGNSSVTPEDYIFDLTETYEGRSLSGYGIGTGGYPQFIGEWGDLSGSIKIRGTRTGDNFVVGTTSLEDWENYLVRFFKAMKQLTNSGILCGFNWWGGWEDQNTSILRKTGSGTTSKYYPNWRGQMLANFFIGDGMQRAPVAVAGTYTEASPSFGGRNMYF